MFSTVHSSSLSFAFPSAVNSSPTLHSDESSSTFIQASIFKPDTPRNVPSITINLKSSNVLNSSKLSKSSKFVHSSSLFGESICSDSNSNKLAIVKSQTSLLSITNGTGLSEEKNHDENGMDDAKVPGYAMMMPQMKKGFGSLGGVTIERTKLDLSVKETKSSPQLDIGGGGGNIGNKNFHGGGDGGDDGGDDDDYFGGEDDGEDGDDGGILRKSSLKEIFDRATVEAVMKEWFKTMNDLPAGIKNAVELGIMSTAQLVRYFSVGSRPTLTRKVSRIIPEGAARSFMGRVMADPAFIFKFGMEQAFTAGTGVLYEMQSRGEKFKDELDLAAANVFFLMLSNAFLVWKLSPSRSYWSTARYDWQKAMERLPNHVFDKSYPLKEFNLPMRVSSFFFQSAQLCLAGSVIGSGNGLLSNALVDLRKKGNPDYSPSVPSPSVQTHALANGAFLGLSGNVRYQFLFGLDRVLSQHLNSLSAAILGSTALRYANIRLGESSRISWLGLETTDNWKRQKDNNNNNANDQQSSVAAYRRPSLSSTSPSPSFSLPFDLPFALPSALVAALPFLANIDQSKARSDQPSSASSSTTTSPSPPPTRRLRRKVKRKVSMST